MKKQISLPPFWSSTRGNAHAVAEEYVVPAGLLRVTSKPSRRPVPPTARGARQVGAAVPGGAYKTISIGLPPIDIGPPDLGNLPPIAIPDEHPPPEGHDERREDKEKLGHPREELDPKDFTEPWDPDYNPEPGDPYWDPPEPDPDPPARGGGGGGGG